MSVPLFQQKMSEFIKKVDGDISINSCWGWDNTWNMKWRHHLLKILLKDQLKHFDRS